MNNTRRYYRKESAASSPRDQRQHAQFAEYGAVYMIPLCQDEIWGWAISMSWSTTDNIWVLLIQINQHLNFLHLTLWLKYIKIIPLSII
jgi:hypothetical protein